MRSERARGPRPAIAAGLVCAALAAAPRAASAGAIDGRVFVDVDRDGLLSTGDPVVPGVMVWWETSVSATTDADGHYELDAPGADGIAWVRVPEGYQPSPVWAAVPPGGGTFDLALVPVDPSAGDSFVVGSDLHIGKVEYGREQSLDEEELLDSFLQSITSDPPPRFIAVTGDLAQSNRPEQYAILAQVASVLPVPLVPVPGNHDWYDGGASYRAALGPPMYSFDSGGTHFVVLNDNGSIAAWTDFLAADLAAVSPQTPIAAFVHRPPEDEELGVLEDAGVRTLFTGHWHSNAVFRRGGLLQLNTEPMVRGGLDGTPAGYRVVSMSETGLTSTHRAVVETEVLRIVSPAPNQCAAEGPLRIIAAVEVGAGVRTVRAEGVELTRVGGWNWSGEVTAFDDDEITVEAVTDDGAVHQATQPLLRCVCGGSVEPGDWSQVQGGPAHRGESRIEIAPPLRTRWTAAVGGHPAAAPIVAGGRVFISVADLAEGAKGGVVALDLDSGAELWRFEPGSDVRNAVAVEEGVVVVPLASGTVLALDAASGSPLWKQDLGADLPINTTILHAAPTVADQTVYIGVLRNVAALDLHTGAVRWRGDPDPGGIWLTSRAAAAVADGLVIGSVGRGTSGAFAWSDLAGEERWRLPVGPSVGIHASPVLGDGVVYLANSASQVLAVETATGAERWRAQLMPNTVDWDYSILATPALAGNRLFVPTMLGSLVALDTESGREVWRMGARPGPLHDAHVRTRSSSFPSSPVVTGDILWVTGGDGVLRAVQSATGMQLWTVDLGAPGTPGISAAGNELLVATFDGTVRAMVSDACALGRPIGQGGGGCGAPAGRPGSWLGALAIAAVAWLLFRRRHGMRRARPNMP